MTEVSPDNWGAKYSAQRYWYETLTKRLEALIITLLADAKIDVVNVESRAKSVQSFIDKIEAQKETRFKDPIDEITDIVGVRIITYYLEDVAKVGSLIDDEFEVEKADLVDKGNDTPDRFSYRSMHYVVRLSPRRRELREWKEYANVRAEIQVRTALQHAWSAVHHKLDYKPAVALPRELQRRLYRLNALFELADEQFSQLRDQREKIESSYKHGVREGLLEIPLNEASIKAYFESGKGNAIAELAALSGANIVVPDSRRLARDREDLLSVLTENDITTVAELDDYLTSDILPTPIPDGFFGDDNRSMEDALTVLIMTDKRMDEDTYSRIYMPDGWPEFVAGMRAWRDQKRHAR